MRRVLRFAHVFLFSAALVAVALFSVGCGSSSSSTTTTTSPSVRFVNASPDQMTVNILIDGTVVTSGLAYGGTATAYLPVTSGARRIQIQDPTTTINLIDTTPTISGPTTYVITGYAGQGGLSPVILTDNNTAPAAGMYSIRVINVAPTLNHGVDAYVELSTITTLNGLNPTFSALPFPPATASAYMPLTAGSWEIVFTAAGSQAQPFFGSPAATTFASGQIETVLLVETGTGTAVNYAEASLVDVP